MVKAKKNKHLQVHMNGIHVGTLEKAGKSGLSFRYEQSWIDLEGSRPISLSMPLVPSTFDDFNAYNYFDNLLPDNPKIRARIQARFHTKTDHPFDLLASIGKDCVGAIQISEDSPINTKQIQATPLSDTEIAETLKNYRNAPLGMEIDNDDFRISIAGAQEKSALLYHNKQWCRPHGVTPTSHIFKLPIGVLEHQQMDLSMSCENEWLCSKIAQAFGLTAANCEIKQFDDVKVLVVERFDREYSDDKKWIFRMPQEDICQALGLSPNLKYQSDGGPGIKEILGLFTRSIHAQEDRDHFIRTQILFWLLAAIDGHAKNFSIFIKPYGRYHSTPLYDIMSAHPLLVNQQLQQQKIKMAMALKGKNQHYHWHQIKRRHFISTATAVNFPPKRMQQLLDDMLEQLDDVIEAVARQLPKNFPDKIAPSIFDGMTSMRDRLVT